jgi:hypothetical protein
MMNMSRRQNQLEAEERRVRRDERESSAGKLIERFPDLVTLDLAITEARPSGGAIDNRYIRRIVVEHAPALFELRCSHSDCQDGVYDLTRDLLAGLAARKGRFEGERSCAGRGRAVDCTRVLSYVATATYRTPTR